MTFHNGIRTFSRRIDVVRNGAAVSQLYAAGTPSVDMNYDAEIKMSMSGTFQKNATVDLLTDHVRPYVILDGIEYPLGEYVVVTAKDMHEYGASHVELEAYDLTQLVKRRTLEDRVFLPAGTKYTDAVQAILIESGLVKILCDSCDSVLATDREDWEPGESWLTVVNTLLSEINFNSLWIDLEGNARLTRYRPPDASSIRHTYRNDEFSVLCDPCSSETDIFGKSNVFVAIVSNPDYEEPLRAVSVNDSPESPLNVMRLGRIASVERLDNIADLAALQEYVDNQKFKSMIASERVEFVTAVMPVHEVGDVIGLHSRYLDGIYEEIAWTISLGNDGQMIHKARRVMYL